MPKQAPLRLIKRCRLYLPKSELAKDDVKVTRGLYVLYEKINNNYNVKYIGVGGTGNDQKSGIFARLKSHIKIKKDWTHYSIFEVHDNISTEEIKELEGLFLTIFRKDQKIELLNVQKSSNVFVDLSHLTMWPEIQHTKKNK